jgi:SAM-dependent methyltransferase
MFLYAGVGRGADVGYRTGLGYRTGRGRRRGREIPTRARVLDFGSGPNPVLARILQALGCKVWTWDPYFQRGGGSRRDGGDSWRGGGPRRNGEGTERPGLEAFDAELAARSFDWIVLHEVLEHIFEPARTLRLLSTYLAPGGRVAISTRFAPANPEGSVSARTFASWWYRLDLTHVSFFGPKSLELLGSACGMSLVSAVYPRFAVLRRIV